tara:strand:+ start:145904 stop:146605 length:702 start_codon:yes stop_codon:yes gene_type:complete
MKNFIFIAFLIFGQFSYAQTKAEQPLSIIEVEGVAKMEIIPNRIYVNIDLMDDLKNNRPIDIQEREMKKAILDLEIELKNLSISNTNADYVRIGWIKKGVLKQASYTLVLEDAVQMAKLFKKLDQLKVHRAYISRLDHSEMQELRKQLRIKAIKAAKEKATYLLEAIEEKAGKPIYISESNNYGRLYNHISSANFANIKMMGNGSQTGLDDEMGFSFKKISLEAKVEIKFQIL